MSNRQIAITMLSVYFFYSPKVDGKHNGVNMKGGLIYETRSNECR